MLIVNQIENTHFSKTEREIVDYIIDQGMNIEKMSANEIARNTFTSAPLLVRIAKKLGYSGFNEFKSAYLKELAYMLEETDVDASIPFLLSDDLMTISKNIALLEKETNCPNCGAVLDLNSEGVCSYCHTLISNGDFGWILIDMKSIKLVDY